MEPVVLTIAKCLTYGKGKVHFYSYKKQYILSP
jgi:hypothetical protein